jgi:hypothetical protein
MTAARPDLDDPRHPTAPGTAAAVLLLLIGLTLIAVIATLPVLYGPALDGQLARDPSGDPGDTDGHMATAAWMLVYFIVFGTALAAGAAWGATSAAGLLRGNPTAPRRGRLFALLVAVCLGLPGLMESRASTFVFTVDSDIDEFTAMGQYRIEQGIPTWLGAFDLVSTAVLLVAPTALLLLLAFSSRRMQVPAAA